MANQRSRVRACCLALLLHCLAAEEESAGATERDQLGFADDFDEDAAESDLDEAFFKHFELIDSNGDGFLEYNELDARLHKAMLKKAGKLLMDEIFP